MRNEKFFVNFFKTGLKPGTIRLRRKDRWIESKPIIFANLHSQIIRWMIWDAKNIIYQSTFLGKKLFSCKSFFPKTVASSCSYPFSKYAFTAKVFHSLGRVTKDSVFGICELFEKSSIKNFYF